MTTDVTDASRGAVPAIAVVAAVIESDGRILVTRRLNGTHLEGMWEFPGGKLDDGETHEVALRREIREELDAAVVVRELLLSTVHHYPGRSVELFFYRCDLDGDPKPMLGQEMQWIARSALRSLAFPPADGELIDLLSGGQEDVR
jgi:mutator protein MutT